MWKQLVGGTCTLAVIVSMVGPTLRAPLWVARTRPLHHLTTRVKTGVLVAGSAFINVLAVFLVFRVGDLGSGSYYCWCVVLALLCLQFFAGMHIIGANHWWVRSVAVAAYTFGISALFGAFGGLLLLVASSIISRLNETMVSFGVYLSSLGASFHILIDTMLKWCYPTTQVQSGKSIWRQEQEEACHYHKVYEGGFGNFRYKAAKD